MATIDYYALKDTREKCLHCGCPFIVRRKKKDVCRKCGKAWGTRKKVHQSRYRFTDEILRNLR